MNAVLQPNNSSKSKLYFIAKIPSKRQTEYQRLYFELISAIHGTDEVVFDAALAMIDAWHANHANTEENQNSEDNHNNNNSNNNGIVNNHENHDPQNQSESAVVVVNNDANENENENENDRDEDEAEDEKAETEEEIAIANRAARAHNNNNNGNHNNTNNSAVQRQSSLPSSSSSRSSLVPSKTSGTRKAWTPIMFAVHKNRIKYVAKFLARGVDPNVHDSKKRVTLLHMACEHGYSELSRLLLMNKPLAANINALDKNGQTPVFVCCLHNNVNTLQVLLDYESHGQICDINLPKLANQQSCMYTACDKGYKEIVQLLLQYQYVVVNVNAIDNHKRFSPLMRAVIRNHSEIVQILLTFGADINHLNNWGRNSLMLGAKCNQWKIMKILVNYGNSQQSMINLWATDHKGKDIFAYIQKSRKIDKTVVEQIQKLLHASLTSTIHFCRSDLPNRVILAICLLTY